MRVAAEANRRSFLAGVASSAAVAGLSARATGQQSRRPSLVGIQVGAASFVDEGIDQALDNIETMGSVDTLFLAAFTYTYGFAGRKDGRLPKAPFPDHGVRKSDATTFVGGNYASVHPRFYAGGAVPFGHAPDYGGWDLLKEVVPVAKRRGLKNFTVYEDQFPRIPDSMSAAREVDFNGRQTSTLCPLSVEFRTFLASVLTDHIQSYDIDGIMWASERSGPLEPMLSGWGTASTCFCDRHQKLAKSRGINAAQAAAGFRELARLVSAAKSRVRLPDGYFVSFWRLISQYPEILAWDTLWTETKHSLYEFIYAAAKRARPDVSVGFHIWHVNSFSPFVRAQIDYKKIARAADFLKVVVYNNCGGFRFQNYVQGLASSVFSEIPEAELERFLGHTLGYEREAPLNALAREGLSPDYVGGEIRRAVTGVDGRCAVYAGIDVNIPGPPEQRRQRPEDVYAATSAALTARADGIIFSRKYSEMWLANLKAGGAAVKAVR